VIAETRDPAVVNAFANHPDIQPAIGGQQADFTGAMRETAVFLFGEHGGFIYEWCAPGTYEVHVMLTKAGRGRWGFTAVRQSLAMMAERGADHVWCRIRDRTVAVYAAIAGFRDAGEVTLYADDQPVRWRIMNWRAPCRH